MFGLVYEPPTIDPDDDRDLLIERYSIEIAAMNGTSEPYLFIRMGKVVLRDGTYSRKAAVARLHALWLESYIGYTRQGEYNHQLTTQVALWVANDRRVAQQLRVAFLLRGNRGMVEYVSNLMPDDLRHQIDEDFGGLEETCWLTVARELPLK